MRVAISSKVVLLLPGGQHHFVEDSVAITEEVEKIWVIVVVLSERRQGNGGWGMVSDRLTGHYLMF